jgi:hypothetical protein
MKDISRLIVVCLTLLYNAGRSQIYQCGDSINPVCPVSSAFISNKFQGNIINSGSSQSAFTSTSIITCGNFRVYFEDMLQQTGDGFDDPIVGVDRRNTFCAVLSYVQSVINITVTIDLHVDRSFTASNPSPVGTLYAAIASPKFTSNTFGSTPGYWGGNFYDHVATGTDPDLNDFDGYLQFNFDKTWEQKPTGWVTHPLFYWNNYQNTTAVCRVDLYSLILHEVTHTMGWLSGLKEGPPPNKYLSIGSNPNGVNSFSKLDQYFLWYGNIKTASFQKLVTNGTNGPLINNALANTQSLVTNMTNTNSIDAVWLTNSAPPRNYKVYDGYWFTNTNPGHSQWLASPSSYLSHLDKGDLSLYRAGQYSPGYQPKYVMAHALAPMDKVREWSLQELRALSTMGYSFISTFANSSSLATNNVTSNSNLLSNNAPPCRINLLTTPELLKFPLTSQSDAMIANCYPESKPADFSVTNGNFPGSPLNTTYPIDTHTLINIADPDNDPIGIFPNSLYGIRGVTTGGNNHNSIVITNSHSIVYTPPPGYYGRAEFGFNLWDGKERGGIKIITIDVVPSPTWAVVVGSDLVINGGFEDATEVRTIGNQTAANSTRINGAITELNYGSHASGAHPYIRLAMDDGYAAGGVYRKDSYAYCYALLTPSLFPSVSAEGFGSEPISCGTPPFYVNQNTILPTPTGTNSNECYFRLRSSWNLSVPLFTGPPSMPVISYLRDSFIKCGYYRLEFDAVPYGPYPFGHTMQAYMQPITSLTNTPLGAHSYTVEQNINVPFVITSNTLASGSHPWQKVVHDFVYCGVPTRTFLINAAYQTNQNMKAHDFLIDNISLKQLTITPPPLTVTAISSHTIFCPGNSVTLTAHVLNGSCPTSFTWLPMNLNTASVVVNPPTMNTSYTVLASDGCRTGSGVVQPIPIPMGSFTVPPVCLGMTSAFNLWNLISPTITTGFFAGSALSNSTAASGPVAFVDLTAPNNTLSPGIHTYTFTELLSNNCIQTHTANISYVPTPTIVSSSQCVQPNQSTTLSLSPAVLNYTWQPGSINTASIVVSPSVGANTYSVTYDNGVCSETKTITVPVIMPVTFTNQPDHWCSDSPMYQLENYLTSSVPLGGSWWSNGPSIITFSTNSLGLTTAQLTPTLTGGTYTINYSYTLGPGPSCSASDGFTLTIVPAFTVAAIGPTFYCSNLGSLATISATANTQNSLNYFWMPGSLSGQTQSLNPSVSTVYTVTASDGTCVGTSTLGMTVSSLCCNGRDGIISSATSQTFIGQFGINQNLTINGDVVFRGDFALAPNVKITITPGSFLHSDGLGYMHVYSCYDMWESIEVSSGGKIELKNGDCLEDGIEAIRSNGSMNTSTNLNSFDLVLNNAVFNRCYNGVVIRNYTQSGSASPFHIAGCVFTSRDFGGASYDAAALKATSTPTHILGSPYNLMGLPLIGLKVPYSSPSTKTSGVKLENSGTTSSPGAPSPSYNSIIVGDRYSPGDKFNLFDNVFHGIHSVNSNLVSFNNKFQNPATATICPIQAWVCAMPGRGIFAENNGLYSGNHNNLVSLEASITGTNNNRFYNCVIAVFLDRIFSFNSFYSEFNGTHTVSTQGSNSKIGILATGNRFKKYEVINNLFQNYSTGIWLSATPGALNVPGLPPNGELWGYVAIHNNWFSQSSVFMPSVNGYMTHGVFIENTIGKVKYITLSQQSAISVKFNWFDRVQRGVWIRNIMAPALGKSVGSNTLVMVSDPTGGLPQFGIAVENVQTVLSAVNNFSGFTINPSFSCAGTYYAMSSNSSVGCNSLTTFPRGSEFAGLNLAMRWRDNTLNDMSRGMQLSNVGNIGQQGSFNLPSDNYWVNSPSQWTGSRYNTWVDVSSNATNSKIVRRTTPAMFNPTNNGDPFNTTGTYAISANLINGNNSAPTTCVPFTPPINTGTNSFSKSSQAHAILNGTAQYPPAQSAVTDEINRILIYRELCLDTTMRNCASFAPAYTTMQGQVFGLLSSIEDTLEAGHISAGSAMLSSFSPSTAIQTNYKRFYQLYISWLDTTLSGQDSTDLTALAQMCPFIDGPIIYNARTLYNLVNGKLEIFNDDGCIQSGEGGGGSRFITRPGKEADEDEQTISEIHVFPNPNDGIMTLLIPESKKNVVIRIFDVSNRLVFSSNKRPNGKPVTVDTQLLNGVYFLHVNLEATHRIFKLIIAR